MGQSTIRLGLQRGPWRIFLISLFFPKIEAASELKTGSHMYLFAIKLPNVNYPPSMHDNDLGYRVDYSLQAFLDMHDQRTMETAPARVMYLPLISCVTEQPPPKRTQVFTRGSNSSLQLTIQAGKPAYCPGEYMGIFTRFGMFFAPV